MTNNKIEVDRDCLDYLIKEIYYKTDLDLDPKVAQVLDEFARNLGYLCIMDIPQNKYTEEE